jgi:hypothetical protein
MTILKRKLAEQRLSEAAILCPECKEVLDTGPGGDDALVGPDGKIKCEKCGKKFDAHSHEKPSGVIRGAGFEARIKSPEILMLIDRRLSR